MIEISTVNNSSGTFLLLILHILYMHVRACTHISVVYTTKVFYKDVLKIPHLCYNYMIDIHFSKDNIFDD